MKSFQQFCETVCAQVRCRAVHGEIVEELTAHLEDKADALIDKGFSQEEAEAQAVAAMGDPAAVGKELDQVHPPVWGVLSKLAGAMLIVFIFLLYWTAAGYHFILEPVIETVHTFQDAAHAHPQMCALENPVIPFDEWTMIHTLAVHFCDIELHRDVVDGAYAIDLSELYQTVNLNPYSHHNIYMKGFSLTADGIPLERYGFHYFLLPENSRPSSLTISYDLYGRSFSILVPISWEEVTYG